MSEEFFYPSRQEKREGQVAWDDYSVREQALLLFKSQEFSELQALILYYLGKLYSGKAEVFFPAFFLNDLRKKNRYLKLSRQDYQIIWICNGHGGGELKFPPGFWSWFDQRKENVKESRSKRENKKEDEKRFLVISAHLWTCERMQGGHANLLIYDRNKKIVERFEPNGLCAVKNEWYDVEGLDSLLKTKFKEKGVNYRSPQSPYEGWQRIQIKQAEKEVFRGRESINGVTREEFILNTGFCVIWTMCFLEWRLNFPEKSTHELVSDFTNLLKKSQVNHLTFIKIYCLVLTQKACNLFL